VLVAPGLASTGSNEGYKSHPSQSVRSNSVTWIGERPLMAQSGRSQIANVG